MKKITACFGGCSQKVHDKVPNRSALEKTVWGCLNEAIQIDQLENIKNRLNHTRFNIILVHFINFMVGVACKADQITAEVIRQQI